MLTLTFLGVGSAFAKRNFHSNLLFEFWEKPWTGNAPPRAPDDSLLVDFGAAGPLAWHALKEKPGFQHLKTASGLNNYPAVRKIFITHQHADHIGGLEELALMNYFVFRNSRAARAHKIELISTINILVNLWDHSLKGGLNTLQHRYALLQDYFFIRSLTPAPGEHGQFLVGPHVFEVFPTDHIQISRKYDWPSYGLYVHHPRENGGVFFSGDTRCDYPAYGEMLEAADVCFHDCQFADQTDAVHATISELRALAPALRKKMYLYHFGDNFDDPALQPAIADFAGLTKPQHRYILFGGR